LANACRVRIWFACCSSCLLTTHVHVLCYAHEASSFPVLNTYITPPNHRPTNVSSSEASSSSFCCCWGLDRVGTYTRHRRSPCGRVVGQGGHADTARLGRSVYTRRSSSRDRRYAGVTTVPAANVSSMRSRGVRPARAVLPVRTTTRTRVVVPCTAPCETRATNHGKKKRKKKRPVSCLQT